MAPHPPAPSSQDIAASGVSLEHPSIHTPILVLVVVVVPPPEGQTVSVM